LGVANPSICHVGFSATIWRTDTGLLHEGEGAMFKKIAYACDMKQLIKDGWLVPLISKSGSSKIDLTNVHIRNHEYDQKDLAFAADNEILVKLAVEEIVRCGKDRKSWLVFASSILHAQHIKAEFKKHGVDCEIVTGDTPKEERDKIVGDFRSGKTKCLVNVSVFIKGFDVPRVDLLALMTATQSSGKFVQACGRGMRPFVDQNGIRKESCVLLDFGTNVQRLGMIDDIDPVQTKTVFNTVKTPPPIKECPKCHALIHARIIKCPACGYDFGIDKDDSVLNHGATAYSGPVMVDQIVPYLIDVKDMWVSKHSKPGKTPSLKIAFYDNLDKETSVWACLDHKGYAAEKARALIKQLGGSATSVEEGLKEWSRWKKVDKVQVKMEGKWPRVTGFVFAKNQSTQQKLVG
jgi:DNA repair protein RadD